MTEPVFAGLMLFLGLLGGAALQVWLEIKHEKAVQKVEMRKHD